MSGGVLFLRGGGGASLGLGGGGGGGGEHGGPIGPPDPVTDGIEFQYTVYETGKTSAGVYLNSTGVKVRDLWSGVWKSAGLHTASWDGKDDFGNTVIIESTDYDIRVLEHNVGWSYSSLFNTSKHPSGIGKMAFFGEIKDFAISGTNLIINPGDAEGETRFYKSAMATPSTFSYNGGSLDYIQPFRTCADATSYYYIAGYPRGPSPHRWGVLKRTVSTGALGTFSGLTSDGLDIDSDFVTAPDDANFSKVFLACGVGANSTDHTYDLVGIAVQQTGNYLAFTQKETDTIYIVHKGTGAEIATLTGTVTDPTAISWSPDEAALFVGTGSSVKKLQPAGGDWTDVIGITTISPGSEVCDIACSSGSYDRIAVATGAHQIKLYNATTNALTATVGASGGYASTTVVADNRFHFYGNRQSDYGSKSGVRLQFDANDDLCVFQIIFQLFQRFEDPDSTPTTDDGSTFKMLNVLNYTFGAERTLGTTLIINGFMAMTRDWSVANKPGFFEGYDSGTDPDPAWTWDAWYGYAYDNTATLVTPRMERLWIGNSGKLYGILIKGNEDVYIAYFHSTGVTEGTALGNKAYFIGFDDDGNYYQYVSDTSYLTKGTLTGFTANLPTYTTSTTYNWDNDAHWTTIGGSATKWLPILSDGTIIMTQQAMANDPDVDSLIYHIAAIASDGTIKWKHGLAQSRNQMPLPTDGKISAKGNGGGCASAGIEDLCVLSAQGEGFESGQAGLHNVYDKYGLYLCKLGHETPRTASLDETWPAIGENGNAQSCVLVYDGTEYRYMFNDEHQSTIQEYTSVNSASIQYATGTGQKGQTIILTGLAALGGGPSVYGSAGFTEIWDRADSDTIGNSWTEVNNGLQLTSNFLEAKTGEYNKWLANHIYRDPYTGSTASNVSLRLTIPAGSLSLYTRDNGSEHRSMFGLFARYNSGTKLRIGVTVSYIRQGDGDDDTEDGNGVFEAWFYAYDGTTTYDLGFKQYSAIEGWDTDSFSLTFNVTGTQPTRMHYSLFNETTNEEVLTDYTELWDTAYESAGKVGMHLGMENVRCSKFEELALTWSSVLPPVRS